MPPKVPETTIRASFWEKLPALSREWLSGFGVGPDSADVPEAHEAAPRVSAATQLTRDRAERRRLELQATQQRSSQERAAAAAKQRAWERLTPREKRLHRTMKRAERDRVRIDRVRARQQAEFPDQPLPELATVPRSVYIMVRDVYADETGAAVRTWFARSKNKVAIGLLRKAALVPDAAGRTRYTWADARARAIAAIGLALMELAIPTQRKGAWSSVVKGVQLSILCALLSNPWEPTRRPHRNTIGLGFHRVGGTLEDGQVGYLRALQLSGFLYAQQLPPSQVSACERFLVRRMLNDVEVIEAYASNRYWIITDAPTEPHDDDEKRRLLAAHSAGMLAAEERPQRQPRTWYERALELVAPARAAPS